MILPGPIFLDATVNDGVVSAGVVLISISRMYARDLLARGSYHLVGKVDIMRHVLFDGTWYFLNSSSLPSNVDYPSFPSDVTAVCTGPASVKFDLENP